jgi:TRAP-type C4-dicarboxylate transport system substrate-binding protein
MKLKATLLFMSILFLGMTVVSHAGASEKAKVFKWKMQTFLPSGTVEFKALNDSLSKLRVVTQGRLDVTAYPVGAIVGLREQLEGLGAGVFQAAINTAAFFTQLDPGFSPLFSVPGVWKNPREVKIWFHEFGGKDIWSKAYAKHNVHLVGLMMAHAEPLFSKKPINTLDDFKGLIVRTPPGLTHELFVKLGAKPTGMSGSEIYTALDTGVIDAAEFVSLSSNYGMGLHEVTKYVLWPSFHAPITADDISVNMDAWAALPDDLKQAFRLFAAYAGNSFDYGPSAKDYGTLKKIKDYGLKHVTLSKADQDRIKSISLEVVNEYRKKSALADTAIGSILNYLRTIGELD